MSLLLPTPNAAQVRAAREAAGHTQEQAAAAMGLGSKFRVSEYERGAADLDPVRWTLYLLSTGQHPTHLVTERAATPTAVPARRPARARA